MDFSSCACFCRSKQKMRIRIHRAKKPAIEPPAIAPTDDVRELWDASDVPTVLTVVVETMVGIAVGDDALGLEVTTVDAGMLVKSDGTAVLDAASATR